ncbi:MAG: carnitine dehydratase [Ponticaulis sp.]|nr:carnitine dehydratase [Ponticaulis sp.]
MAGALDGIRVIEFAGIGPGPFCAMMLADHGAEVIRIERQGAEPDLRDPMLRNREFIHLDLKSPQGVEQARDLCRSAHALIEGFRPGVMEKLGLGPDALLEDNPTLVYGRMTGWGQTGPLAQKAGHDINYIAVSGVLNSIGREGEPPIPPLNYVGDFGGGAMMLAFGILAALMAVKNGGSGQVVDAAMTDGSAVLSAMTWHHLQTGFFRDEAGVNLLNGGAHFYRTYKCADDKYIAVGAIEPQFYAALLAGLELSDDPQLQAQFKQGLWEQNRQKMVRTFLKKSRDEWVQTFADLDACVSPVLSLKEAAVHPHNIARNVFQARGEVVQPMPAPRLSGTPAEIRPGGI